MSEAEVAFINQVKSDHLRISAGTEFIHPEQRDADIYTIYSGWAYRYKELADARRQILNFFLPGDLIGLQASLFEKSLYGAIALTDIELCVIPKKRLIRLFERMPELAYDVTWLGARSEADGRREPAVRRAPRRRTSGSRR